MTKMGGEGGGEQLTESFFISNHKRLFFFFFFPLNILINLKMSEEETAVSDQR